MNPMKVLADQTADILRLLGVESREEAADLLPKIPAMKLLRRRDVAGAGELSALVLGKFPRDEPPSEPNLDWLPAVQADAATLVAEAVAVLDEPTLVDHSRYGACPKCGVSAGEQCVFVLDGKPAPIAHRVRPLVEVTAPDEPKAEACGCRPNDAGLHLKTCPVWVNVGPSLAKREYVRRDSLVAEAVAVPDEPVLPREFDDVHGCTWRESVRDRLTLLDANGKDSGQTVARDVAEARYGPLVEVPAPVKALPAAKRRVRMGDTCGPEHTYRDACQYAAEAKS